MNMNNITRWYSGKAKTVIETYVLPGLAEAAALGCWPPNMSRKVCAALNKMNVAAKFAKSNERREYGSIGAISDDKRLNPKSGLLDDVKDIRGEDDYKAKLRGWSLTHAMKYGSFGSAPKLVEVADKLAAYCITDTERAALATAKTWAEDFTPVAELVARLDATRPKPVILLATLSPTVLTNLSKEMAVDFTTLECPEIVCNKVETVDAKGNLVIEWETEIIWPEGTVHNRSRFAYGTNRNHTCHACGHAIKNSYNWVPLVGKTAEGYASLWVGKDCAKNLFGCKVTGETDWSKAKS